MRMKGTSLVAAALLLVVPTLASAQYLCVRVKDGALRSGTSLRIRDECSPREMAIGTLSGLIAASDSHDAPDSVQPTPAPVSAPPTPTPDPVDARFLACPCYADFNVSHPEWMGSVFPGIETRKTQCSSSRNGQSAWDYEVAVMDRDVDRIELDDLTTRHVSMNLYAGRSFAHYSCYVAIDAPAWGGGQREIVSAAAHEGLSRVEREACIALWHELGCSRE